MEGDGLSSRELLERLDQHNRDLMEQAKARHQINNQLSASFAKSLESVSDSNRMLADALKKTTELGELVTGLRHTVFGVDGRNGLRDSDRRQWEQIDKHTRYHAYGFGGLAVLQVAIGIAVVLIQQ